MKTKSEELLSNINAKIFFKEFSFSKNEFSPKPGVEFEFADHVIWIDDFMFVFQVKERLEPEEVSEETERKWFEKKVIDKGIKQIHDTMCYLEKQENIVITNQRGHAFKVDKNQIESVIKIIIHAPSRFLPSDCLNIKYRIKPSIDFIHIIPQKDYLIICQTFITPSEIKEYLDFREKISKKYCGTVRSVSEQALIGQFVYGDFGVVPNKKYEIYYETLLRNNTELSFSYILHNIYDHIIESKSQDDETKYYKILIKFAKLAGFELRETKERISLSLQACIKNEFQRPYRIISPRTGCGFVFIPIEKESLHFRLNALQNLTYAAKYDQKLDRCIGIVFAFDGEVFLIDWALLEFPWKEDKDMESLLNENFPFQELKCEYYQRYFFSDIVPKKNTT